MRPARQGAFDALCGLYAVVNAIEMVGVKGARSEFHRRLFTRLARGLAAEHVHDAVCIGLDETDLLKTTQRAFRWVHRAYGLRLSIGLPLAAKGFTETRAFVDWYDDITSDGRHAVIINIVMPWLDHWTVAARRRGRTLLLRDSESLKSLDLKKFQLSKGDYRIRAACSLVIARVGGPEHICAKDLQPLKRLSGA